MSKDEANDGRRVKVRGHPRIYYRRLADGSRRYEFTYRESTGRQRWQTVDGDLQAAIDARDQLRGRLRRGERIAARRQTFAEAADAWLARQTQVRPRTREAYDWALRIHLKPRFGPLQIAAINEDEIAALIADMQKRAYKGWTIQAALAPLRGILNSAARAGQIPQNPMQRLERSERPSVARQRITVLGSEQIGKVIEAADANRDRVLIATGIFTGLRLAELLALTWDEIDFDGGYVRVRAQLDRSTRRRVPLKTDEAHRDVVLMPALAKMLREYRLRSLHSTGSDYVFPTHAGGGLDQTVARRALKRALEAAGIKIEGFTFHGLRHTFASLLIAQGRDVSFVAGQMGHSDPAITLKIYTHLFDHARHAADARAELERDFGNSLVTSAGKDPQRQPGIRAVKPASQQGTASGG